jgi:hypothetical protein
VFENRFPRITVGPRKEEVMEGRRKLHSEEPHNLQSSPSIITSIKSRRMNWLGKLAHMEKIRNAYRVFIRKSEGKRWLGRSRHRWEDNITMDYKEKGWEHVN